MFDYIVLCLISLENCRNELGRHFWSLAKLVLWLWGCRKLDSKPRTKAKTHSNRNQAALCRCRCRCLRWRRHYPYGTDKANEQAHDPITLQHRHRHRHRLTTTSLYNDNMYCVYAIICIIILRSALAMMSQLSASDSGFNWRVPVADPPTLLVRAAGGRWSICTLCWLRYTLVDT